eukprot:gene58281-biopygen71735
MQQVQLTHALPQWQHGFRPKHGCHTAVMHLVSSITSTLERGEDCVIAAMDLSAAFDTVDHELLLRKLQDKVGIKGAALQLFRSYLKVKAGEDVDALVRRWVQRFVDYCAANRIAAEPEKTQLQHIKAKPQPKNTFAYLRDRLPGRWYARSKDLEVPSMSVSRELDVHFDDQDVYRITEGPTGECQMQGWTVSSVKGRHLFWRNDSSVIRWTRYVYQPVPQEESEHSADESDSEDSLSGVQEQQPTCTIGGQAIPYKEHVKILGMLVDRKLSWKPHCQAMAAKT